PRAVEAQHAHAIGERGVAGGDGAAVAEAAEGLRREEAEGGQRAQRPPAPPPSESAPAACAASSITGTPSASISATGQTLPKRWTAMTAFVRGVSAALTVSAVTEKVSGSTSQKTGRAPVGGMASALA